MKIAKFFDIIETRTGTGVRQENCELVETYIVGAQSYFWVKEWGIEVNEDYTVSGDEVQTSICLDRGGWIKRKEIDICVLSPCIAISIAEKLLGTIRSPWDFLFFDEAPVDLEYAFFSRLPDVPTYLEIMKRTNRRRDAYRYAERLGLTKKKNWKPFTEIC